MDMKTHGQTDERTEIQTDNEKIKCVNLISYYVESGKVELWDLEAGENIRSARSDDSVTCIKVNNNRLPINLAHVFNSLYRNKR